MKRAFTIYVDDDCKLNCLNICTVVAKEDDSDNGLTVFTFDKKDFLGNDEYLFKIDDKAQRILRDKALEEPKGEQ